MNYPSPSDISYAEDSRWCQDHGHTGLLVSSPGRVGCQYCDLLVNSDPRFAAALTDHKPDGTPVNPTPDQLRDLQGHHNDDPHGIDPPSGAAELLDTLIDMADYSNACKFGQVGDTQPAGVGEAAVHVHNEITNADYVIVCVPARLAQEMAQDHDLAARVWETLTEMAEKLKDRA